MKTKIINGIQLHNMLKNGLENLRIHEDELNDLNVFPVPDGDTGTNMLFTLKNGIEHASVDQEVGRYLKSLSEGMLLGARGNSGVILSQIFKGLYLELSRCSLIGPGELRNGLIRAYRTAYSGVVRPVEGTILTVSREGIEHIRTQITRYSSIDEILSMYISEMKKTLACTPQILDVLGDAGVVDSGAKGYITIFEGMLMYLYGDIVETSNIKIEKHKESTTSSNTPINKNLFDQNSFFTDGYCLEFILQLMRSSSYTQQFRLKNFTEDLEAFGTSIVIVQDDTRIKVHIHTMKPGKILTISQEYGEFLSLKIDNMQIQHNENDRKLRAKKSTKPLSIISVTDGEGIQSIFKELGCDTVIDKGASVPTVDDFLDKLKKIDSKRIIILSNDKDMIPIAEKAVAMSGKSNVTILPTKSMAEGYFAIASDVGSETDIEMRIRQMRSDMGKITTIFQTIATTDNTDENNKYKSGDEVAIISEKIVASSNDWSDSIFNAFSTIGNLNDKDGILVIRGKNTDIDDEIKLKDRVLKHYPLLEVDFIYGGQVSSNWTLGIY